jgi:hypothetical protein
VHPSHVVDAVHPVVSVFEDRIPGVVVSAPTMTKAKTLDPHERLSPYVVTPTIATHPARLLTRPPSVLGSSAGHLPTSRGRSPSSRRDRHAGVRRLATAVVVTIAIFETLYYVMG